MYVDYAAGPFRVNYAYEKHKDTRAAVVTAGVTESAQNLAGTFVFGPVKVGALTQKIKSTNLTDKKAYFAAITFTTGMHEFIGTIGRVRDGAAASVAVQPESKLAAIGYNYNFSKRTTFMTRYAEQKNNSASALTAAAFGLPAFGVNDDPKGFSAGLRHTF
jgi:predicted porin